MFGDSVSCLQQSFQSCKYHREVVQTSAGDEFVVYAESAGGSHVVEIKVEIHDIGGLDAQFVCDDLDEQVAFFQFVLHNAEDGQHVFLLAQFHSIVDLTVEVDGKVRYLKQRTLYVQQTCFWMHGVLCA